MDKKDWKTQLKLLENLLIQKKIQVKKTQQDIEELDYTISCYKQKINSLRS